MLYYCSVVVRLSATFLPILIYLSDIITNFSLIHRLSLNFLYFSFPPFQLFLPNPLLIFYNILLFLLLHYVIIEYLIPPNVISLLRIFHRYSLPIEHYLLIVPTASFSLFFTSPLSQPSEPLVIDFVGFRVGVGVLLIFVFQGGRYYPFHAKLLVSELSAVFINFFIIIMVVRVGFSNLHLNLS
jgi:hypothetical protein